MSVTFDQAVGSIDVIETGDGFLDAWVAIAKPGVFAYLLPDGTLQFRAKLPEDLFSQETIESARNVPVTDDHPMEFGPDGLEKVTVNSENFRNYIAGTISEPQIRNGMLMARERVMDPYLIAEIKSGLKREVSIGFENDLVYEPGVFEGEYYDCKQTNIRVNHLAHVDVGRAGEDVKIQIDSGVELMPEAQAAAAAIETEPTFSFRTTDGKDIAIPKSLHSEFMTLKKQVAELARVNAGQKKKIETDAAAIGDLKNKVATTKPVVPDEDGAKMQAAFLEKIQGMEQQIEDLETQVEEWSKKYETSQAEMPGQVEDAAKERSEVMDAAKSIVEPDDGSPSGDDDDTTYDGLSTDEIKLQVISKVLPFARGITTDSIDKKIIDAQYRAAVELSRQKAKLKIGEVSSRGGGRGPITIDANEVANKREAMSGRSRYETAMAAKEKAGAK